MLHIHRAERADGLIDALRALLADPLPDPFAPELVAVPTRGMERWLTQRMSDRLGARPGRADGVCANVGFPPPRAVVTAAIATAAGVDPETDPWLPERMVWPLLEVIDDALEEPWLHRLAAHLGGSRERARRFGAARHLADLFDGYALHRPELVRDWTAGNHDGWQAELWRRLRERIAEPDPAERLERACARLRAEPDIADLPPRLSVFGLTRLPTGHLHVFRALADRRDVHLFLLHPSPALWARIATGDHEPVERRATDPTATVPTNRVLASWAHDAREMQLVVTREEHEDHHHPVAPATQGTLLARIQADVRADRGPLPPPRAAAPGAGRSQRAGARLPRPRPAGRGPARRDPAPARRGPRARAARRDRDVPRHRDLRPAHPRHLRGRRGRRGGRRARGTPAGAAPARPARAPGRPVAAPDQPGAGRDRPAARARRRARHRLAAARPRRPRARPPPLPVRRRRPGPDRRVGAREPGSAGGSTARIAPRSSSRTWRPGRGSAASTACCSA